MQSTSKRYGEVRQRARGSTGMEGRTALFNKRMGGIGVRLRSFFLTWADSFASIRIRLCSYGSRLGARFAVLDER